MQFWEAESVVIWLNDSSNLEKVAILRQDQKHDEIV